MEKDSRARMVRSAAALIAARGMNAASFSEVLADSGAPRGSIYHHFPGGKAELAEAAVRLTSEWVLVQQRAGAGIGPRDVLGRFIDLWRRVVTASGGASGCAVAGTAIDTDARTDALIEIVRDTFRSWITLLAEQLRAAGIAADRAEAIAVMTLASMEGALILCRAERNAGPLETVAEELLRLLPREPAGSDTLWSGFISP